MLEPSSQPQLCLAPLRGLTHAEFRSQYARCFGGFQRALAPFVVPESGKLPPLRLLQDAFPETNPLLPTIPQVLTEDASAFVAVAQVFLDAGCSEINWNLGCPHPMVTRRKRGAGMLPHPDRIRLFLDRVLHDLGPCVSVKMRLGLHHPNEAFAVIEVLNHYPLKELILHPRTGAQMYRGSVDLEAFSRCLAVSSHPITYNGDIVTLASFREKALAFPRVVRWMIGRGAITDPFLASSILQDRACVPILPRLEAFHAAMLEHYSRTLSGDAHVLHKMKELWIYWANLFDPKDKVVKKVLRAKRLNVYEQNVRDVLAGALP